MLILKNNYFNDHLELFFLGFFFYISDLGIQGSELKTKETKKQPQNDQWHWQPILTLLFNKNEGFFSFFGLWIVNASLRVLFRKVENMNYSFYRERFYWISSENYFLSKIVFICLLLDYFLFYFVLFYIVILHYR